VFLTKIKKYAIQSSPKGRHYQLFKSVHCKKAGIVRDDVAKDG
jgi:hypothetical protein